MIMKTILLEVCFRMRSKCSEPKLAPCEEKRNPPGMEGRDREVVQAEA